MASKLFCSALLLRGLLPAVSSDLTCDMQAMQVHSGASTADSPTADVVPQTDRISAQATGDPHLQNMFGQRFDLMRPGSYPLIRIPRGAVVEGAFLHVAARAVRVGAQCADIYFQEVNVTGAWVEAKHGGGLYFSADEVGNDHESKWLTLGMVDLRVARGYTLGGTGYLNFFVKHLGRTRFIVGGLLGVDDHEVEATPDPACRQHLALRQEEDPLGMPTLSIAEATML